MADLSERIKLFRFVRDIPYRIGLAWEDQDYCCATKTPMLQKLFSTIGLESRRICCQFEWAGFGLPENILAIATTSEAGHEYLEVFVPEKKQWVKVDPTWDSDIKLTGLPIAEWDGLTSTVLAVSPSKTFSPEESLKINEEVDQTPREAWQEFFALNRPFLGAINNWLEQNRIQSRIYAQTH